MIYLSCVLLVAVGCAAVAFSDHTIRRPGRMDTFGLNASSWDFAGTMLVLLGAGSFLALVIKELI